MPALANSDPVTPDETTTTRLSVTVVWKIRVTVLDVLALPNLTEPKSTLSGDF